MHVSHANLQTGKEVGGFMDPYQIVVELGIREGMTVSEFGCGSGFFSILIGQKVGPDGKVYALDILESALDSVRSKAKSQHLNNIETVHTNLEVLGSSGLADESQDFVLLINMLFQSKNKDEIIKEARRVLKNDGRVVIIDWAKGSGGMGPPDSMRTDDISMQSLALDQGLVFDKKIHTGKFHYGLVFKK